MATECPHGRPLGEGCIPCIDDGMATTGLVPYEVVSRPFAARFGGICDGCGGPIWVGQQIVRLSGGTHCHDLVGCRP